MLQVLTRITVAVGDAHRVEEVIRIAAAEIHRELGLEMAGLYLWDSSTGILVADPYKELTPLFVAELPSIRPGESPLFDKAIASKKIVAWPVEEILNPPIAASLEAEGLRSIACLPLLSKSEILGVIILGRSDNEGFSPKELETLQAIGAVIGAAIENAKLIQQLRERGEQLSALTGGIQQMRELEARRIARNLHDIAGQLLTAVHLRLEEVAEMVPPDAREHLHAAEEQLHAAEEQLRQLSHELRSPVLDDLGLEPALEFLVQGFAKRTGLKIKLDCSTGPRLVPEAETVIYRSVQEALTNVAKHARATRVWIALGRDDDQVHCTVRDDGNGFDASTFRDRKRSGGIGLLSIEERVSEMDGKLTITSAPGQGTALSIMVPAQSMDHVFDARDRDRGRHHLA